MKKNINYPWIIAIVLLYIFFNTTYYSMIPSPKVPAMWACYGFITFAFIINIIVPFVTLNDKRTVISLSLYLVTFVYLLITLFLSYEMLYTSPIGDAYIYLSHVGLLFLFLILFVIIIFVNRRTNKNIEIDDEEIAFIKNNVNNLKNISLEINDKDLNKKINECINLLHSSPKKTKDSVSEFEKSITNNINLLKDSDNKAELLDSIILDIKKRNNTLN